MRQHPHTAEMEQLGRQLWGAPNAQHTNAKEIRFGRSGSKSIARATAVWFDHEAGEGGGYAELFAKVNGRRPPDLTSKIVATYDYNDADGRLLFQVIRQRAKRFVQRRPDGSGGWVWNAKDMTRVPYRLPELLKAEGGSLIFVAEGEKDVDALRAIGLTATCNPGGAGKWQAGFAQYLRDRDVVILPDNDDAGAKHAQDVARKLLGAARSISILNLPDLPEKGDVSDWLAAGGTADSLLAFAKDAPLVGEKSKQNGAHAAAGEWEAHIQRDDFGKPLANLANAALMLRESPELAGLVAFDEMARTTVLRFAVPGSRKAGAGQRPLQDADISAVQEHMQRQGLHRIGRETVLDALSLVATEHAFHPVRRYLDGLRWDGVPRLASWLTAYLGVDPWLGAEPSDVFDPPPYVSKIGSMFLIAMVARIMRPGAKCDYMLTLEGPQGARKSTACAILGGNWFSDSLPQLEHGDAVRVSTHLRGKWLIEIGELSSISKAEAGALKAFLTQTEERFLPKYGRSETIEPRQCVFVGTTNKSAYLRDETGGRRFWPVRVGEIDTKALARDRDQLFAEAVVAFRRGDLWWPSGGFEAEHIAPQQAQRFDPDVWESLVADWLKMTARCTVAEVARDALHFEAARIGTADQRRIAAILERVGWTRGNRGPGGTRFWFPPARETE